MHSLVQRDTKPVRVCASMAVIGCDTDNNSSATGSNAENCFAFQLTYLHFLRQAQSKRRCRHPTSHPNNLQLVQLGGVSRGTTAVAASQWGRKGELSTTTKIPAALTVTTPSSGPVFVRVQPMRNKVIPTIDAQEDV